MLSEQQIAALKFLVFTAKDGTELTKRLVAFLGHKFIYEVGEELCITLVDGREGYSAQEIHAAAVGLHAMNSVNGTTHLGALQALIGSQLRFQYHYGDFDPTRADDPFNSDGQFAGADPSLVSNPGAIIGGLPVRYTFWLSYKPYSRQAKLVMATREELEAINLQESGLYPSLESA